MANSRILTTAIAAVAILCFIWAFKPDPAPADGKLHLRYWEKWTGSEEDAMRKVVNTFNARQDRIQVEYLSVSEVNKKMILATAGGLVEHLVKLNDKVEAGQKVAIQRNSFGEVVADYKSGVAGEITGQRSDAMSEPGNPLVFILFNKATQEGVETYPE